MKTKRIIIPISTLALLLFLMSSCSVFKKNKCDCPKFNQIEPILPLEKWGEQPEQELALGQNGLLQQQMMR